MAAIIDLLSGDIAEANVGLPYRCRLPDDGVALFSEIGDTRPEHDPRYKAVEEVVVTEAPLTPYCVVGETRSVVKGRVEVSRVYAPDVAAYQEALERHVEGVAISHSYSSAVSLATYAASAVPLWKAEADAFVAWRDQVWVYVLGELDKVQNGERKPPPLDVLIAELPAMVWP